MQQLYLTESLHNLPYKMSEEKNLPIYIHNDWIQFTKK